MKKIILLLMAAAIITSCGTTTIFDVNTRKAKVEDIIVSPKNGYKHKVIAWQYEPRIKKYIIYTDSLYSIGSWVEIKK